MGAGMAPFIVLLGEFLGPIGPLVVALSVCLYVCNTIEFDSTLTQLSSDST